MNGQKKTYSVKQILLSGVCGMTVLTLMSSGALAQVESATTIADPSRAAQDIMQPEALPALSSDIKVTESQVQNAPEGAENIKLQLQNLQIDGVSAYDAEQIDPVYRSYLGTTISLTDVYAIANDLTVKYRNDGYILTQVYVPPQTIENGTVRLQVVEGFVDQIKIQGDLKPSEEEKIREYAENLKKGNILNAKNMERYLLLINDLPGVKARAVLGRSPSVTGASDLTLIIERDKYEAEIGVNNHGSKYLGPYQGSYNGSLNSIFGFNEEIGTQFVLSGDKDRADELLFGSVSYAQPISKYGTKINFLASTTATEPGHDLRPFDVHGYSQFGSVSLTHPFIRSRTTNWFGRATFDARDVKSKNNLEPFTREDRIRSVRLGTTVQFMDTMLGIGVNALDLEFSQGVDVFGASQTGDTRLTRGRGDPSYKKVELYAQRLQRLTGDLNLLVAGSGQWSSAPLLSSEEFGVGGQEFGRGYDSSEIVGDDGIAGKVELQWNEPRKFDYLTDYQIYTYFDAGRVWNQDATTSAGKRDSIASTGLGFRAEIAEQTTAGLGVAFPLTRNRDTTNDRDPRYYFNVSHEF